jgi:signal transduction histidine kinase
MSPLAILKLVGFATGAALHLYISWLIWNRRMGSRQGLTQPERMFIALGLCLGVWFLGNLFITLHEMLLGRERLTGWLRAWDTITMAGVALVPSALLHAHVAFWGALDNYRVIKPRHVRLLGWAFYAPMIFLPVCAYLIVRGGYESFLVKLRPFLVPYSIWYVLTLVASAAIDWAMKDKFDRQSVRERTFFKRLAVLLVFNAAFEFYVVVLRRPNPNDYLWVMFILYTLLPTFFIAYHIYRYKFVDVAIKDSLVYAVFAILFIAVYNYGIRRLDQYLFENQYIRQPGVIEVILILAMFAMAGPVVRVLERWIHRLFAREFGLYRDVVRQVSAGAAGFGELDALVKYTEQTIRRGLDLSGVRIIPYDSSLAEGPARRLAEKMMRWEIDLIESDGDLAQLTGTIGYALRREGELIGLMIITAESHTLTSEKRAVLDVLAGQVAIEVESCRLVEEKVRLERQLASRERLATLGQMAAQVAHEVKNPLSSIKSIAQVMREEEALTDYDRDLSLIVSEIDRLNRTVSQLLAFSRPSHADLQPVALRDLLDSTVAMLSGEANERGVEVNLESVDDLVLPGFQAGAIREAVSNLVINAVQATDRGGAITVETEVDCKPGAGSRLTVTVTDTGPGIPDEARQKVFEPFYSTKSRGTGLGLAIVQRRAVELGGAVELISPVKDDRGTRFRLTVPLEAQATEAQKDIEIKRTV